MNGKKIRDGRTLWAQKRSRLNAENKHLTDSQHRALSLLACYRHKFHCDLGCLFYPESGAYRRYSNFFLNIVPTMLRTAGLPPLSFVQLIRPAQFESIEESEAFGEKINEVIENYLAGMDFLYGTWYAPCGYSRECVELA